MGKARSPEYPAISLGEAIDRVKAIYDKDYQNPLPKKVIAEHMGYKSLSGASLPILSALSKYGLLEGRGDETRVSDLAVALIAHPPGTPERMEALKRASVLPELFDELDKKFPHGKASDQVIRSYLLTKKFIPTAADAAIRAYRDTKELVEEESEDYSSDQGDFTPFGRGEGMQTQVGEPRRSAPARALEPAPAGNLPVRVVMSGNRLEIQASVDLEGLKKLQTMLTKYQGILEMMEPDEAASVGGL